MVIWRSPACAGYFTSGRSSWRSPRASCWSFSPTAHCRGSRPGCTAWPSSRCSGRARSTTAIPSSPPRGGCGRGDSTTRRSSSSSPGRTRPLRSSPSRARSSWIVLATVWFGAALGLVLNFVWLDAPKWVSVLAYFAVGWVGVITIPQMLSGVGLPGSLLVMIGGVLYTLGALVVRDPLAEPVPGNLRVPRGLPRPRRRRGVRAVRRRLARRPVTLRPLPRTVRS